MEYPKTTPMMDQWISCKKKAKDALLLFRLGDFYEAFYEDAHIIAKELNLTLTKRQQIPMCGVPFHTCEGYIDKLVAKGHKVAIAEQMGDPRAGKGIVDRQITRILSPATIINSLLLSEKNNNFFVSLDQVGKTFGLCIIDLSTSEFRLMEFENKEELLEELYKLKPSEFLLSQKFKNTHEPFLQELSEGISFMTTIKEDWHFDHQNAREVLMGHFQVAHLDGLGLSGKIASINASGALFTYLVDDLHTDLSHIRQIQVDSHLSYMSLDPTCMRNLEIFDSFSSSTTLLDLLDHTHTPMGGRLFRFWLKHPLLSKEAIIERQDATEELLQLSSRELLIESLKKIKDLERLNMKISSNNASARDILSLRYSLENIEPVKRVVSSCAAFLLENNCQMLHDITPLVTLIENAVIDNPPLRITEGDIFKNGYSEELDELRSIKNESTAWLANYQNRLREELNIKTLRVGYNRVFGYYIEVSKGQAGKMPESFHRKQTLVNSERFISEKLKEFEHKVLSADDRIKALEQKLFQELRENILLYHNTIAQIAKAIAVIDAIVSFTISAKKHHFVRPQIDDSDIIDIKEGRHPIIEESLPMGKFIPNDTYLDPKNRLFLITGPNMAGKSTYIRQVALIVIMAQIGSYVPAKSAHIGMVDKVFSRIGASDNLSKGQSTFMVEMTETANILHHVTSRSLVILDEIGRGTSTYDGISIAWSVAEYLLSQSNKQAKTLFATHYWELTDLEEEYDSVKNFNVAIKETEDGIAFLHKIVPGGTDKSYGIHVAKLAGLPYPALKKAKEMLKKLEDKHQKQPLKKVQASFEQPSIFSPPCPIEEKVIKKLKEIDLDLLSPLQAHQTLLEIKQELK